MITNMSTQKSRSSDVTHLTHNYRIKCLIILFSATKRALVKAQDVGRHWPEPDSDLQIWFNLYFEYMCVCVKILHADFVGILADDTGSFDSSSSKGASSSLTSPSSFCFLSSAPPQDTLPSSSVSTSPFYMSKQTDNSLIHAGIDNFYLVGSASIAKLNEVTKWLCTGG